MPRPISPGTLPDFARIGQGDADATRQGFELMWGHLLEELRRVRSEARRRVGVRWTTVSFDSTHFSATAGTWSVDAGDVLAVRYKFLDGLLAFQFNLGPTSTSVGMSNELRIKLPGGFSASDGEATGHLRASSTAASLIESGTIVSRGTPADEVALFRAADTTWPDSLTDLFVRGTILLEGVSP